LSRYWLNPNVENFEEFAKETERISALYMQSRALARNGTHVVSCDEKTGIQALERIAPTKPPAPGEVEKREFEYTRHGTVCLIANLDVATGKVVMPTLGPTRTEEDFVEHVRRTIATDPKAGWVFVVDQLNTHISEGLVRLVAKLCGTKDELGKKRGTGVLKTMSSRRTFLADENHRIRFVYTPKHCSWMNQIEIWFSVLARRLLRRASFVSIAQLSERIRRFIDYFNDTLAKPFKWTFTGIPLRA
jgi:transposase